MANTANSLRTALTLDLKWRDGWGLVDMAEILNGVVIHGDTAGRYDQTTLPSPSLHGRSPATAAGCQHPEYVAGPEAHGALVL